MENNQIQDGMENKMENNQIQDGMENKMENNQIQDGMENKMENNQIQSNSVISENLGNTVNDNFNESTMNINNVAQKYVLTQNKIILIIISAFVIIGGLIFFAFSGGGSDFNKMYSNIAYESYCTIGTDGLSMKIDTNYADIDDYFDTDAYYEIESINLDLGFTSALFTKMGETSSIDGRQYDENDKYKVSWKYHPDSGLEVTYEIKN